MRKEGKMEKIELDDIERGIKLDKLSKNGKNEIKLKEKRRIK